MKGKWYILLFIIYLQMPMSCTHKDVTKIERPVMVGGYGLEKKTTSEDKSIFAEAVKMNEICKDWKPIAVSYQVVAGVNYRFICKDKNGNKHQVKVFRPLPGRGEPLVFDIDGKR